MQIHRLYALLISLLSALICVTASTESAGETSDQSHSTSSYQPTQPKSNSLIERLPKGLFSRKESICTAQDICAICQDPIRYKFFSTRKINCGHGRRFHRKCLDGWFDTCLAQPGVDTTCPVCRAHVPVKKKEKRRELGILQGDIRMRNHQQPSFEEWYFSRVPGVQSGYHGMSRLYYSPGRSEMPMGYEGEVSRTIYEQDHYYHSPFAFGFGPN